MVFCTFPPGLFSFLLPTTAFFEPAYLNFPTPDGRSEADCSISEPLFFNGIGNGRFFILGGGEILLHLTFFLLLQSFS